MSASLVGPISFVGTSNELVPETKGKKKGNILKEKLKVYEILKREGIIKNDHKEVSTYKKPFMSRNLYTRIAVKVVLWTPVLTATGDFAGNIAEMVASEVSFNCQYAPWAIALTAAVWTFSVAVAIIGTKMSNDLDKKSKKESDQHEKELQEMFFAQFTEAFDNYKKEVEKLLPHRDQLENHFEEIEEGDAEIDADHVIEKLENSLNECLTKLNQCSKEQQNHFFTKEIWISQLIYLLKKGLKNAEAIKKQKEVEKTESEKKVKPKVLKLTKKASKNAKVLTSQSHEKLTSFEQKNPFSSEMAGPSCITAFSGLDEEKYRAKFSKTWHDIEKICGDVSYLVIDKKIIGCNGMIYHSETEAKLDVERTKEKDEEESPSEVIIDIKKSLKKSHGSGEGSGENEDNEETEMGIV